MGIAILSFEFILSEADTGSTREMFLPLSIFRQKLKTPPVSTICQLRSLEALEDRCTPTASSFDLSSLLAPNGDGTNGFVMNGINAFDRSGRTVNAAGDVNGDGFDDLIIGAYRANPGGRDRAGQSYVVFGKASGIDPSLSLSALNGTNGFALNGIDTTDYSGRSVSSAGDINGDGFGDLVIGAFEANPNNQNDAGESYVIFGKESGFAPSIDVANLNGVDGFTLLGINAGDDSGFCVRTAGDINGDGFDDLLIGARLASPNGQYLAGESYVVFGKQSGFAVNLDLSSLDGTNGFTIEGDNSLDVSGFQLDSAGDINGDGYDDIVIGAFGADLPGRSNAGKSYIIFGKASGFAAILDPSTLNGTNGFAIHGIDAGDYSGFSVHSGGDINGDGFKDVVLSAMYADPNDRFHAGQSYVVFGKGSPFEPTLELSSLDGTNGFIINGINAGDRSGFSVSAGGDINGDGFDDLLIGADFANPNGRFHAGQSYVIFGKGTGFAPSLELSTLDGNNGFAINGVKVGDGAGFSVSMAGDFNGDGFDDLLIGAFGASPNYKFQAGQSYLVFGSNFTSNVTHLGTAGSDTINGTVGSDSIVAGQGNDTVIGFGGPDVIYAGQGDDSIHVADLSFKRINGGRGNDRLVMSGSGFILDLNKESESQLTNIEDIDLGESGNNRAIVSQLAVLNLSPLTNTLIIQGDAGDAVKFQGVWNEQTSEIISGIAYRVFSSGQAIVKVQEQTATTFSIGPETSPIANAGGPYAIYEGQSLVLNGAGSFDPEGQPLTYSWDVNGDDTYGDAAGVASTLTWAQLQALGITDGTTTLNVKLRVDNGWGGITTSAITQLTVYNEAPVASIVGIGPAVRNETITFSLTAIDPSPADQAADFVFEIDWDNDGNVDQTVVGASGTTVTHAWGAIDTPTISVTAIDKDGSVSSAATLVQSIVEYTTRVNGDVTDLIWGGSTNGESYTFDGSAGDGTIHIYQFDPMSGDPTAVYIDVATISNFTGTLRAYGGGGNDALVLLAVSNAVVQGGEGNDAFASIFQMGGTTSFFGGNGYDQFWSTLGDSSTQNFYGGDDDDFVIFLDGSNVTGTIDLGNGNDTAAVVSDDPTLQLNILGGANDDFIIGGVGADTIDGGTGNDFIIGDYDTLGTGGGADSITGGDGNDVIIAGGGADSINGGLGQDLIISGRIPILTYVPQGDVLPDYQGYQQVWDVWRDGNSLATRKAELEGTSPSVLESQYYLQSGTTMLDDGAVDSVLGSTDGDWLVYDFAQDTSDYLLGTDLRTNI